MGDLPESLRVIRDSVLQSPATRAAREGAPPPMRAPIRSPAVSAYNARQQRRRDAPHLRNEFERQGHHQAFASRGNQFAELPQIALEATGLPSVRRAASEYTRLARGETGDLQAANEQAIWGALGVGGLAVPGARGRAPPVRPRAPPTRIYRGINEPPNPDRAGRLGDRWWHTNPEVASTYAPGGEGAHVIPGVMDESSLRLAQIETPPGTMWRAIPTRVLPPDVRRAFPRKTEAVTSHEAAAAAEAAGYEGVTFSGMRDSGFAGRMDRYPGFGTGDQGRVVALFNDQAARSPFPEPFPDFGSPPRNMAADQVPPATRRDLNTWGQRDHEGPVQVSRYPVDALERNAQFLEQPDLAAQYAARPTPIPPVIRRGGQLVDGRHRLGAARLRGDSDIESVDLSQFDGSPPPRPQSPDAGQSGPSNRPSGAREMGNLGKPWRARSQTDSPVRFYFGEDPNMSYSEGPLWKEVNRRIQSRDWQMEDVRLEDLTAGGQDAIEPGFRRVPWPDGYGNGPPVIIRHNGRLYIEDGNHRLVGAAERGVESARVAVIDADAIQQRMRAPSSLSDAGQSGTGNVRAPQSPDGSNAVGPDGPNGSPPTPPWPPPSGSKAYTPGRRRAAFSLPRKH